MIAAPRARLFLGQGVPLDAALAFRKLGFQCDHVAEIGTSKADDTAILQWATEHSAVVLTLDADFHALLAVSGASGPSVIRLRIQGMDGPRFVALMASVLARFEDELNSGSLVTVKARKITAHRLPIGETD